MANPNDALIALRLEVEGLELMDRATGAIDRASKAKERMGKTPGELTVQAKFIDNMSAGLKNSESNLAHYTSLVETKTRQISAALDKVRQEAIRTGQILDKTAAAATLGISAKSFAKIDQASALYFNARKLEHLVNNPDPDLEQQDEIRSSITRINALSPHVIGKGKNVPLIAAGAAPEDVQKTLAKNAQAIMEAMARARYAAAISLVGPAAGAVSLTKLLSSQTKYITEEGTVVQTNPLEAIRQRRLREFGPATTKEFSEREMLQSVTSIQPRIGPGETRIKFLPAGQHVTFDEEQALAKRKRPLPTVIRTTMGPDVGKLAPPAPLIDLIKTSASTPIETTARTIGPQLTTAEINAMAAASRARSDMIRRSANHPTSIGPGQFGPFDESFPLSKMFPLGKPKYGRFEENLPLSQMYDRSGEKGFVDPRLFSPIAIGQALRARLREFRFPNLGFANWGGISPSATGGPEWTGRPLSTGGAGRKPMFGGIAAGMGGMFDEEAAPTLRQRLAERFQRFKTKTGLWEEWFPQEKPLDKSVFEEVTSAGGIPPRGPGGRFTKRTPPPPPGGGPPPGVVPSGASTPPGNNLAAAGTQSFLGKFGSRFTGLAYYSAAAAVIYPLSAQIYKAFETATDLEVIMKRIQGIYGSHTLGEQLQIKQEIVNTAQKYSERIEEVARTAQLFAQEQVSLEDLPKQLNAAAIGARAFGLEMSDVAGYIIRVQNATSGRVGGQQAVDLISALAARGAVAPQNIMTAIEQLSPMLEQFSPATGPLDEQAIIGAMASYNSRFGGITGSQLSNAMKFMISRFGSVDATRMIQRISGVELGTAESQGENLRPFIEIMTDLAAAYNKLLDTGQSGKASELLRVLFSTRQTGPGNIILKYWTDELQRANESINDHDTAIRQAMLQQDTWAGSITRLQNSLAGLAGTISTAVKPSLGGMVDFLSEAIDKLNRFTIVIQRNKITSPILTGLGHLTGITDIFTSPTETLPGRTAAALGDFSALGFNQIPTPGGGGSLFGFTAPKQKGRLFEGEPPTLIKPGSDVKNTAFLFIKDIKETAEATVRTAQSQYLRGVAASNLSTIRNIRQAEIRAQERRDPDASYETRLTRSLQLINLERLESEDQINLQQKEQAENIRVQIALKNHYSATDSDDRKRELDKATQVEINSELKKLDYKIALERVSLANKILQQQREAEINFELEKQVENLRKFNEMAQTLNQTLKTGLTQFPQTLANQKKGAPGNVLTAFGASFLAPLGAGLYAQGINGADIFGKRGLGAGVTRFFQNVFNPDYKSDQFFGGQKGNLEISPEVLPPTPGKRGVSEEVPKPSYLEGAIKDIDFGKEGAVLTKEARARALRQAALAASLFVGTSAGSAIGGSNSGAQTGATVGAIAGSLLPIPGGTYIGAVAGGIIGGFIGGKDEKTPPQINQLQIIADNSREQVRLLENTNLLLANNLVSFNVPTGFTLPSYQPNLFGGGRGNNVNNTEVNVQVQVGTGGNANEIGAAVAQAISDRLELESRSSGIYSPRLIYG